MKNPYEVLGVSPNATDDEVKAAYRALAKKYHPDNYENNPLQDVAAEKMQEINEAYDSIMNSRRGGGKSNASGGYTAYSGTKFSDIRTLISQNRLDEAQRMLDSIPISERNAEWYFLNGSVQYRRGWFDNAYSNFSTACNMDPSNSEYRAALNQIQYSRRGGNPYNTVPTAGGCSACDMCQGLICADCCCECMGGDLIRCC